MEDFPNTVYKYLDWKKDHSKAVLLNFQLFLASPKSFNDPFDCRIPVDYTNLNKTEIEKFASKFILENNIREIDEEKIRQKIVTYLTNDPQGFQDKSNRIFYKQIDEHLGVLSMSCNWNNILLWAHYGDNHKGYCIGFNEEKLRKSEQFGAGGKVKYPYSNQFPRISPLSQNKAEGFMTNAYTKSNHWAYEEEYRFTKIFRANAPALSDRIKTFNHQFVEEVIIGVNINEKSKDEIINFCKPLSIPVYQSVRKDFHFELDRKRLI